ncbi:hypothetical protein IWQ60_008680 [Tieghemiomyces parasiticus]|uniref:Uncharacterized protein n=1 Tax=Tieghemiomyces parasiticus TaxID=78921 RepID=A0A9W8DQT9_9FUNG|nr:hypothetical protein IWQ60_008680 [Tieghemiomyces parasiticus]
MNANNRPTKDADQMEQQVLGSSPTAGGTLMAPRQLTDWLKREHQQQTATSLTSTSLPTADDQFMRGPGRIGEEQMSTSVPTSSISTTSSKTVFALPRRCSVSLANQQRATEEYNRSGRYTSSFINTAEMQTVNPHGSFANYHKTPPVGTRRRMSAHIMRDGRNQKTDPKPSAENWLNLKDSVKYAFGIPH